MTCLARVENFCARSRICSSRKKMNSFLIFTAIGNLELSLKWPLRSFFKILSRTRPWVASCTERILRWVARSSSRNPIPSGNGTRTCRTRNLALDDKMRESSHGSECMISLYKKLYKCAKQGEGTTSWPRVQNFTALRLTHCYYLFMIKI